MACCITTCNNCGWKMKPQDQMGLDADDYRIEGSAYTFRVTREYIE